MRRTSKFHLAHLDASVTSFLACARRIFNMLGMTGGAVERVGEAVLAPMDNEAAPKSDTTA